MALSFLSSILYIATMPIGRMRFLENSIPYWVIIHGGLDPYVLSYRRFRKMHWLNQFGRLYLRNAQQVIFATSNEQAKASPYLDGVQSRVVPWPVESLQITQRVKG